jgi:hypothetical protein
LEAAVATLREVRVAGASGRAEAVPTLSQLQARLERAVTGVTGQQEGGRVIGFSDTR